MDVLDRDVQQPGDAVLDDGGEVVHQGPDGVVQQHPAGPGAGAGPQHALLHLRQQRHQNHARRRQQLHQLEPAATAHPQPGGDWGVQGEVDALFVSFFGFLFSVVWRLVGLVGSATVGSW